MIIAIPKEIYFNEKRVAAIPATVKNFIKEGLEVWIESDAGKKSFYPDKDYSESGAHITPDSKKLCEISDILIKVNPPTIEEAQLLNEGTYFVSLFQTMKEKEIIDIFLQKKITAFSMHLIPRTTLAQKMDALSSQSNIAGYLAVLMGAAHLPVYMPLLMTAAGTIPPAKVLILGAGVAGLQAIATARRLGANVEVFDVRPEVKEQVESLGAKFIEVERGGSEGVGEGGYAKETSEEYQQKQKMLIKEKISRSNLVITTALIPGRPAPVLIPLEMVEGMKPGAVIMDLAAENGGNCELTQKDEVITHNGVIIDGTSNIAGMMSHHASQLYAKNISTFITYLIKDGKPEVNLEDEIISGALFTHEGQITHKQTAEFFEKE
jgi:NAD(P) transhydrogenase subunit alpha